MRHLAILALLIWMGAAEAAIATEWSRYSNSALQFSISVPAGDFRVVDEDAHRLTLQEIGGEAQIDVFGGEVGDRSFTAFSRKVESADPDRQISYRASGSSWFVFSGYLPPSSGGQARIFYAKFMLDGVGRTFSAFEISYPLNRKRSFDATVARLERSLSAPERRQAAVTP